MTILWVEDNFPQIADIVQVLERDLPVGIQRECHVTDAFELIESGSKFSAVIIDVMLPLGGLSIPSKLLEYRGEYDMAQDTEFSGVLLAEYILHRENPPPIVILSDFCNLATKLDREHDHVHLFFKQEIDEYLPRLVELMTKWISVSQPSEDG